MKTSYFAFCLMVLFVLFSCKKKEEKSDVQLVTVEETKAVMDSGEDIYLLDVRTPEEFEEEHLFQAINIPVTDDDFKDRLEGLDKNKPVYIYCKSGNRSARAGKILSEMGFEHVYDVEGGITKWREAEEGIVH